MHAQDRIDVGRDVEDQRRERERGGELQAAGGVAHGRAAARALGALAAGRVIDPERQAAGGAAEDFRSSSATPATYGP